MQWTAHRFHPDAQARRRMLTDLLDRANKSVSQSITPRSSDDSMKQSASVANKPKSAS